jgi:hypothetical protein
VRAEFAAPRVEVVAQVTQHGDQPFGKHLQMNALIEIEENFQRWAWAGERAP